jgi:AGZA family xanthine/uracil permease-like MFS transporter
MLIGILVTTAIAWSLGVVHFAPGAYTLGALSGTALKLDIPAALNLKGGGIGLSLLEIVFVFLFVDVFDNVGTLAAVAKRAGLVAADGSIPGLNRILLADSASMLVGAVAGTSPVTSYIESAAGVAVGGRTGLTSVVVGVLFLCTLFFAPLVQAIPAAATAPALDFDRPYPHQGVLQSMQAQRALPGAVRISAVNLVHAGMPLVEAITEHWDVWQHGVPP